MSFETAFQRTVGIEGKFSNNPADRGGPTMYGITERVARANGYDGDMSAMPLLTAQYIYKVQYWDVLRLDDVNALSPAIAEELFDTSVNCGVGTSGKFLQRSLNVFNQQGRDYGDLNVDGVVGPVTVADLKAYLDKRGKLGEQVMLRALNALQGVRYIEIAEKDPTQETFEFGWFANRVTIG